MRNEQIKTILMDRIGVKLYSKRRSSRGENSRLTLVVNAMLNLSSAS